MKLNLTKDLVFFDIESTGLNVIRDRIIQIALIKYKKEGGDPVELELLVNPGIPISEEAMAVHGITPDDVRNKPTFQQVAGKLFEFIGDADLGGYNSARFDIPMLMEEFYRAGYELDMSKRRGVDAQRIFYKMEPRTLKAAYKFYCDKDLVDAHDAMADVRATADVFIGQLEKYQGVDYVDGDGNLTPAPIKNDIQAIHDFTNDLKTIDATQRLKYNTDGVVVFNFGKYINKPAGEVLSKDKQYFNWMLEKEFSFQVKSIIKKLVKEYEQANRS
jgi:DNA polymerase-3 subunit epsilon